MSYSWSFLDCRVHLLHRHRRPRQEHQQVHRQVQLRSEVTSSHPGNNWSRNPARESKDSNDRLRDRPEWLEEFTGYLEDAELLAPAHISHDSDSERLSKVASRKHSIETHFPRDRNCDICLRTKITRGPCRKRTGTVVPRAEKFGDLTTADETIIDTPGW